MLIQESRLRLKILATSLENVFDFGGGLEESPSPVRVVRAGRVLSFLPSRFSFRYLRTKRAEIAGRAIAFPQGRHFFGRVVLVFFERLLAFAITDLISTAIIVACALKEILKE